MKKTLMFMVMLVLCTSVSMAAPRTKAQMQKAALQAISQQRQARHMAPRNTPVKVMRSCEQLEVIGYEDGGFAIVAADDLLPAVLGVSTAKYSDGQNTNFEWWLEATNQAARHLVQSNTPLQVTKPDPVKYPENIEPLLTTLWDQDAPYSNMCPSFNSNTKCLTGCVATAMAQVLNYHQSPEHGYGQRTIYYPQGHTTGEAVTANFEEDYYDWAHMRDSYADGEYTQEEADAVALLMRDCGVAADMQYGGPNEGSGTYTEDAVYGLRTYFGYEDAQMLERGKYSESAWMDIIYSELSENGPFYYSGYSYMSGGHAFVFDGYNADGMVSVNWGWSGDDNGYFLVSQLNPGYYTFNNGQDMIVGVRSDKHSVSRSAQAVLTEGGQLQQVLESMEGEGIIGTLTVEGPLNIDDLLYIRHLSGRSADGETTDGMLRILDMTKVTLEENTLPDSIFKGCLSLRRVRLPETITAIGSGAFRDCSNLLELRVTCKSIPELGDSVFAGMPLGTAKLFVRSGLKSKYLQTPQWKDFGQDNIFQVGVSVKARNAVRRYGETNPTFVYTVSGGSIEGTPRLTCDAKSTSPAGRYPIHVSEGSVVNAEAVNFVEGYLVVQRIDATATVQNAQRKEGEPNPKFSLRYEGLINGETSPVWKEEPVIVTAATPSSPAGEYVIYVQSGTAESYNITFKPGKLTVKPAPTGITDILGDATDKSPVYNLNGQRVDNPGKGVFVVNGKKIRF